MKRILFLLIFVIAAYAPFSFGYGRSGDLADPSFLNAGDSAIGLSVSVSSSSVVQVYDTSTLSVIAREVLLQNTNATYLIYCGTHTAVSATSGNRFFIPPRGSYTTNGAYSIWCTAQSGVATIELLGSVEYDSKD